MDVVRPLKEITVNYHTSSISERFMAPTAIIGFAEMPALFVMYLLTGSVA